MTQADNASSGDLVRACGFVSLIAVLVTACGAEEPAEPEEVVTYNIDSRR